MNGDSARVLELKAELRKLTNRLAQLEKSLGLVKQALIDQAAELDRLLSE
jgi:hypothetical protein